LAIYVDHLAAYNPSRYRGPGAVQAARVGARNRHEWCHLIADTDEELHTFAAKIGMLRCWFQGDHYDLTPSRRAKAVAAGAVEVDRHEFVEVLRRRRLAQPHEP
jgi:hypothetical protein